MRNDWVVEVVDATKVHRMGATEVHALRGVTLRVGQGEFVAVMGPSGSGKSTFLNLVGCLDRPTSGSYRLDGIDVSTLSDDDLSTIRSRKIGFVFQQFNLLPRMTAGANIELPLVYTGERDDRRFAAELLHAVGMGERGGHRPAELSGGEQQRVALARALVNAPRLILADEPTGALDTRTSAEIMEILGELNRSGITVILVTHEEDIARYARRLVRFRDGVIISDEPVRTAAGGAAGRDPMHPGPGDGERRESADRGAERLPRMRLDSRTASSDRFDRRSLLNPREIYENLSSAARSLWQNRLRAVLTTLGILIGVAAVIAMVSVGQGSQAQVRAQIESLGSNLLTIIPGSTRSGGPGRSGFGGAESLTIEDADALRAVPGVVGVEPEISTRMQVKFGRSNWNTTITGTTAEFPTVRSWPLADGDFFTEQEDALRRTVCVIGQEIVANVYGSVDPVGTTLDINNIPFRVIGVLTSKGASGFFSRDDVVYVPIDTAYRRLTGKDIVRSITVQIADKGSMQSAQNTMDALLRDRHRLQPGVDDDFTIINQQDVLDTMQGVTTTMTLLLASIAGISLLVGGIGIMNIMLVTVTERTREIGIRKAVGARRRDILAQFLVEAVILSAGGGLLGWAIGSIAAKLISAFGKIPTVVSFETVLLALGFSVAVGIFFGIYPARKASRMDPIQALRFE